MKTYISKYFCHSPLLWLIPLLVLWLIQTVNAQQSYAIRIIKFTGNESFSAGHLSSHITSQGTSKFRQLVLRKKPILYDEKALQNDRNRIEKFYQSEGFLNVKVTARSELNRNENAVNIIIQIVEGEPIRIRAITYHFDPESDTTTVNLLIKKTERSFHLKPGMRFRDVLLKADQNLILKKFSNEGYPYIQVRPEFTIEREAHQVAIAYRIIPGNFCFFGDISIAQNDRTPGAVIRRQLAFKKGTIFKQNLIEKSQLQVYQLGFFQSVSIKAMMSQPEIQTIPIQILVREAPRLTMKFGYGYGIEEDIRVYSDIQRLGFLGGARRMNLFVKHSKLEPYFVNLKFTQLAFLTPATTLLLNSFVKREAEPGYKLNRVGGTLMLQQQFSAKTNAYLSYNLEQDNLEISPETKIEILNNINLSYYNKSTAKVGLIRDTSGPLFSPNHGFFAAADYTLSGLAFDSKFNYTRVLLEFRNYQRLNRAFVIASKLKLGMMKPIWGDTVTPIEDRFFSGGSASVRGWQRSWLGPKNAENNPIGGNSLLEGSAEIRYPIWNIFSGVAFLDFGNVWDRTLEQRLADLRYAAGLGLRINTPIGPIRFDVARPIYDEEKQIQLHLSVGHAF